MRKIIFLFVLLFTITSFSSESKDDQQKSFVYVCNHPGLKCYFEKPCNDYFEMCKGNNGRILKVSLAKAKAMGKEKCDCEKKD